MTRRSRRAPRFLILVAMAAIALSACSPGASAGATPGESALGPRPSSPAVVTIVQPVTGATFSGSSVHVVLMLTGATIVTTTSTNIQPDRGHIHLYVDNVLFSMNYGLEQDLPVHPGTYVLRAEFVASDHFPFNPRVVSPEVFFTVK